MSIIDRKNFFISTPTKAMRRSMTAHVSNLDRLFVDSDEMDCWFHPSPPPSNPVTGRSPGAIKCHFSWKDTDDVYHSMGVNYGIVALIVRKRVTSIQQDGFVYESWHLSHLCGNWTCCNWRHFTIEPGPVNVSRNRCLLSSGLRTRKFNGKCKHRPQCMRSRKIKESTKPLDVMKGNQKNPASLGLSDQSRSPDRFPSSRAAERMKELVTTVRGKYFKRATISKTSNKSRYRHCFP